MNSHFTKNLLGIVALIFMSASAYSQALSDYDQRIYFGVKGGVNLAKFSGDFDLPEFVSEDFAYTNRVTGNAGVLLNYYIGNGIAFQGEVNYSMMGSKVKNNRQRVTVQALNFLELPVLIRYYAGRVKKPQFYIEAGPVAKIVLVAKDHTEYGPKLDAKENYRGASYGITGGLGMQFYAKKYRILVGGRYTMGFTDMHELEQVVNKVRTFTIGVTVMRDIFYYF